MTHFKNHFIGVLFFKKNLKTKYSNKLTLNLCNEIEKERKNNVKKKVLDNHLFLVLVYLKNI